MHKRRETKGEQNSSARDLREAQIGRSRKSGEIGNTTGTNDTEETGEKEMMSEEEFGVMVREAESAWSVQCNFLVVLQNVR